MRKHYLDNIRWITVVIVVFYHVFYMYNAEGLAGVAGKITDLEVQYYDIFQYIVYPWFMILLFMVSGISSRLYLEKHTHNEFIRSRTRKLLVPSTIGLFAFQFLQGFVNVSLGGLFEREPDLPFLERHSAYGISAKTMRTCRQTDPYCLRDTGILPAWRSSAGWRNTGMSAIASRNG